MSSTSDVPAIDPSRFVVPAAAPEVGHIVRIALRLTDRALVAAGQRVELGQPIVERFREQSAVEIPTSAAVVGLRPGEPIDSLPPPPSGRRGRRSGPTSVHARVIEHGRDGTTRLADGSGGFILHAPVAGQVVRLLPGRLDIRADGLALGGQVGWGRPAAGIVRIGVESPEAEIQASRIDVSAAGAILVVGARIDIEALSRARAIGVAAVVSGGVASRDLRQLGGSELRQQAALHAVAPFGLLALGGYGRLPIPRHLWDLLVAAEGRPAGVLADSRSLVIGGDPGPLLAAAARPPGAVRVTGGEHRDREGRIVGLAGPRHWPGGMHAPGGFVELAAQDGPGQRICLPLSLLEHVGEARR